MYPIELQKKDTPGITIWIVEDGAVPKDVLVVSILS